jgi:hypothetical protein
MHHQSGDAAGQGLDELTKQLAMMQLMQANGATANASAPLPHVGSQGMTADFLGALAQLHQEQQQQAEQQQHGVSGSAAMDLEAFLGGPAASAAMLQSPDGSFSCPLPPLYGSNPSLNNLLSPHSHAAAAGIQRVPSANAAQLLAAQQQLQLQLGSLVVNAPTSPAPSEGGKDAPSPSSRARRDASSGLLSGGNAIASGAGNSQDSRVAAPGKKAQPWSAPVSPCTSSKGGNDLTAHDVKLSSISFTAGGSRDAGSSGTSSPSNSGAGHANGNGAAAAGAQMEDPILPEEAVSGPSFGDNLPSFSAGFSDANGSSVSNPDGDAAPLLMIGDQAFSHLGQLQQEIGAGDAAVGKHQQQQEAGSQQQQQQGMGQEMAVKLLAQLPEESVRKLLDLVAKQG